MALLEFATAFANKVFPHPGGPYNNTPAGELKLNFSNFSGSVIGNIILLCNSSFNSVIPPISSEVTSGILENPSLLPILKYFLLKL